MRPIKAKIFTYCTTNINPPREFQINEWLVDQPDIEVVDMVQSESMVALDGKIETNLTITILYRRSGSG